MHPALTQLDHRPWPLPAEPWTWRQNWLDLLFAHWPISADVLRPLVPAALEIEEFAGTSWLGVVPFRMTGVMRRPFPNLPGISAFPELNLRLYVGCQGRSGVWFLSLDAANRLAVWAARRFFYLPYHWARIEHVRQGDGIRFRAERRWSGPSVEFEASFRPTGEPFRARPGSLEHFLTERYCLYAQDPRGRLLRCEVHHRPWPLELAAGQVEAQALLRRHGIALPPVEPLLHFSRGVEVVAWPLAEVR